MANIQYLTYISVQMANIQKFNVCFADTQTQKQRDDDDDDYAANMKERQKKKKESKR
jgi:hypothetical protein